MGRDARRVRAPRLVATAALATVAAVGCAGLLDLQTLETIDEGGDGATIDDSGGGGLDGAVASGDAATDAPPCIDTQSDPQHCGRCGRRCPGACNAGVCASVTLTATTDTRAIAVSGDKVLWVAGLPTNPPTGEIRTCSKLGCPQGPFTLATTGEPRDFITTAVDRVAWGDLVGINSFVYTCRISICVTTTQTFGGADLASRGALTSSRFVWAHPWAKRIDACTFPNCQAAPIANGVTAGRFVASADGNRFVYEETAVRTIVSRTFDGSVTASTPTGTGLLALVRAGDDIAYTVSGAGLKAQRLDLSDAPRTISTEMPRDVAGDDTHIFWSAPTAGAVVCAPRGGGATIPIASGLTKPGAIAVDESFVYVADATHIRVFAKP